jgi:hypothetical protein
VFGIIGIACMNLMAVVQESSRMWMRMNPPLADDAATQDLVRWIRQSVMSVQLGMDASFAAPKP